MHRLFPILLLILPLCIKSQNEITVTDVRLDASFEHVSVLITVVGDDNRNATVSIQYRIENEVEWKPSAPIIRTLPGTIVDGETTNYNHFAGSAMFLEEDNNYEIQIEVNDPDGGSTTEIVNVATNSSSLPNPLSTYYVSPGNGGGDGSEADPFLGITNAMSNAQPGDLFLLNDGTYNAFEIQQNGTVDRPIAVRSINPRQAIIDGDNTNRGIVTIGVFDDSTRHIIIDGLTIRNGTWAIDAQNTQYLRIQNCDIEDVDFGIVNRRGTGWEHHQFITRNSFTGRTTWPQLNGEIPGERAIDLRGNNHVVSYNFITNFGDGVSTDGAPYETAYSLDIHNNDIRNIVDDAIEIDGIIANARVYNNRAFNCRMGVSLAPIYGGPAYIFRNIFYNLETSPFKMNRGPAGLVIVNNTSIKNANGSSSSIGWQNTFVKNNIIMGSRYCFEEFGLVSNSNDDWDYNAYYSNRTNDNWFKWNNIRYLDIPALQIGSGIEMNGIAINPSDLENAPLPAAYGNEIMSDGRNLALTSNSNALDNGISIENMDLPYVFDGMPDRGALELGRNPIIYGPNRDATTSSRLVNTLSFDLFPNPIIDKLCLSGLSGDFLIEIYTANGQKIKAQEVNINEKAMLPLRNISAGQYLLVIKDILNKVEGSRLIIKK